MTYTVPSPIQRSQLIDQSSPTSPHLSPPRPQTPIPNPLSTDSHVPKSNNPEKITESMLSYDKENLPSLDEIKAKNPIELECVLVPYMFEYDGKEYIQGCTNGDE